MGPRLDRAWCQTLRRSQVWSRKHGCLLNLACCHTRLDVNSYKRVSYCVPVPLRVRTASLPCSGAKRTLGTSKRSANGFAVTSSRLWMPISSREYKHCSPSPRVPSQDPTERPIPISRYEAQCCAHIVASP